MLFFREIDNPKTHRKPQKNQMWKTIISKKGHIAFQTTL
jgi:hypothetical protein